MQVTNPIDAIFYVAILIMSVVIHEFAHGYSAYRLGDNTARLSGRLTLNPIKHLDLFGSILLPFLLVISHAGFVLGWAKPVPYNPRNLRNEKKGTIFVSIAGIVANLIIAIIFGLGIRLALVLGFSSNAFYTIASAIVLVNLVLALFNLIPIPPLDGSKVLFSFLPTKYSFIEQFLNQWGIFIMLFFILFLWGKFAPIISYTFSILSGL